MEKNLLYVSGSLALLCDFQHKIINIEPVIIHTEPFQLCKSRSSDSKHITKIQVREQRIRRPHGFHPGSHTMLEFIIRLGIFSLR